MDTTVSHPTDPAWFLRDTPGPSDRPEREDRGPGGPGFYLAMGILLGSLLLVRLLGPVGLVLLGGATVAALVYFLRNKP